MSSTPDWWPHNVESWIEISDYFSNQNVSDVTLWEKLPQGQTNHNYKLSLGDKSYFVQAVNPRNLDLLPQPNRRVSQLELADLSSLRDWLVDCYVDNGHIKISKWVTAKNGLNLDFDDKIYVTQLTKFLIALHSIDDSDTKNMSLPRLDVHTHLQEYFDKAASQKLSISSDWDLLMDASFELTKNFEASKICHNDLSSYNLLWDDQFLKVIDWEYACISDPLFDVAGLIVNCQLSNSQENSLLSLYSSGLEQHISLSKISAMKKPPPNAK